MEKTDEKRSSFAGFLDGYKARNIQSLETNLNYKIEELTDLTKELIQKLEESGNEELVKSLNRGLHFLTDRYYSDVIIQLCSFGESIKTNISQINHLAQQQGVDIKHVVRKIIYNFAELAKMSEDRKLIELTLEIGESYIY